MFGQLLGGLGSLAGGLFGGGVSPDEQALIDQLQAQATGKGPSLAGNQYKALSQDNMAQQLALSRGGRNAGAGRQAAQAMGQIGQGIAQGSVQAQLAERQGALQQLLAWYAKKREMDAQNNPLNRFLGLAQGLGTLGGMGGLGGGGGQQTQAPAPDPMWQSGPGNQLPPGYTGASSNQGY